MPSHFKRSLVLIVAEEFAFDLGSCLCWGKADTHLFVTSDLYIPVKNTLDCSAVGFYVFHITHSLTIACCVFGAVHKFAIRLLRKEQLTNDNEWKAGHAVTKTNIFDRIYIHICVCVFLRTAISNTKGLYPHCAGQQQFFRKRESINFFF